jgi:hypothetical protein
MSRDKEQNLKIVTAGIKVLERMANKGKGSKEDDYRLVQVLLLVSPLRLKSVQLLCSVAELILSMKE